MRPLSWMLLAALLILQYPLWLGKGGWLRVSELREEIKEQKQINKTMVDRNAHLLAEVYDFQHGHTALEERARFELGLIRNDEIFFQVMEPVGQKPGAVATMTGVSPASRVIEEKR
jgi:cell division protein FtsB